MNQTLYKLIISGTCYRNRKQATKQPEGRRDRLQSVIVKAEIRHTIISQYKSRQNGCRHVCLLLVHLLLYRAQDSNQENGAAVNCRSFHLS